MTYRAFWGAKMGKFLGILFLIMLVVPLHLRRLCNILKYLIFQIWEFSQIHTRFWGFSQIRIHFWESKTKLSHGGLYEKN